jgi:aspartyl-tRNA(Asn)/glutamyl-tRNA(Gln) amidotransferase subunit B
MAIIGLEIHTYLNTKEKLFCSCKAIHGNKHSKPNTNICPICTGEPGSKPMLPNKSAIDKAIQIALILNCKINEKLVWNRKHYNWPDLPKGYQNTMSGANSTPNGINGNFLGVKITECHIEEDPAAWNPKTGEIDYNRSGSPLIEIVTDPDFKNKEQVINWLKQLVITLNYIKAIDKNAGIKADVNISLPELKGVRVEIKNINSLKNISKAIEHEIKRQSKNPPKEQETRRFNDKKNITTKMRSKEQAEDYNFISDPDLPTIKINKKRIQEIKSRLPETPEKKLNKLIKKYNIKKKNAEILTKKIEIAEFFEKIIEKTNPLLATRWVTEELLSVLNYNKKELDEVNISSEHFIELINLIEKKLITELKAKDILRSWKEKSHSPKKEVKKTSQISGEKEIKIIAQKVLQENKKAVEDYKAGNQNSINFLIGQVMKLTDKRADYKTAKDVLEKELK